MQNKIKIVILQGSVRPNNYTGMAARLVADELSKRDDVSVERFDPAELDLKLPGQPGGEKTAERLRAAVTEATGVILATPEYHGSFSSVIKLVIEQLGFPSTLAGKPVAMVGVAAGVLGAVKSLESLAGVCLHIGALVLPGAVSVANVQKVFDTEGNCLDPAVEKRVRKVGTALLEYIEGNICPRKTLEAMARTAAD